MRYIDREETIYAVATPPGRSAIAIIRISGQCVCSVIEKLTLKHPPPPRMASRRNIYNERGEMLDDCLLTYFKGPRSYTGEDCVELSLHGGRAVINSVLRALSHNQDIRLAEPGEFTRRAFLNQKLNLSQAEGVAELIDAETELQRKQAFRLVQGALNDQLHRWRRAGIELLAEIESRLDFSDENDVHDLNCQAIIQACAVLCAEIDAQLQISERTKLIRDGFNVVIAGPPNAGKSTLFNALVGYDAAIVSPIAGTTRDPIAIALEINGISIKLVDTAGLHVSHDLIEQMGIEKAHKIAENSDLVLWANSYDALDPPNLQNTHFLKIWLKADRALCPDQRLAISAEKHQNIDVLMEMLCEEALGRVRDGTEGLLIKSRHRDIMTRCLSALKLAQDNLIMQQLDLCAEDLRLFLREMSFITGDVDMEEILDHIFSQFCIGK